MRIIEIWGLRASQPHIPPPTHYSTCFAVCALQILHANAKQSLPHSRASGAPSHGRARRARANFRSLRSFAMPMLEHTPAHQHTHQHTHNTQHTSTHPGARAGTDARRIAIHGSCCARATSTQLPPPRTDSSRPCVYKCVCSPPSLFAVLWVALLFIIFFQILCRVTCVEKSVSWHATEVLSSNSPVRTSLLSPPQMLKASYTSAS
jgi:hypothetical protein